MSAQIDVLAVLDRLIGNARTMAGMTGDPVMRDNLRDGEKARTAVAELIEATDCFTCAIAEDSSYRDDLLSAIRELERASFVEQLNRVRAAIANAGGAK